MPFQPGHSFQHFQIVRQVGEGAMGVVYRARDTRLDRDVALKLLHARGGSTPEYADRFKREARSLAALNHPNIIAIYEIGEFEGFPFLVLEWVDGRALNDPSIVLPLSVPDFLRIGTPVAEALAASHGNGIIHRDVKLANVLVAHDGRVKLVDFGIARLRDPESDATRTAGTVGTVAYMSPEQARGLELGPASDVFSFGVLAYELLAGQRPFNGDSVWAVISAVVAGHHTPLGELCPHLPPSLAGLVERCLEGEPHRRFQSGAELRDALQRVSLEESAVDGVPNDARHSSRRLPIHHEIRFCTTADGLRIAYSVAGTGLPLVRVLGHFTHLELEWEWPDLRLFWERLAERHTVIRYDGRGIGLSDPYSGEFTEETRQLDLAAVLQAAGANRGILLGTSEGGWTAATYAIRHPDRVSHLILYGAYCLGAQARAGHDPEEDRALMTLIRKGWGRDTPAFRQVFTSQFFRDDADPGLLAHFNQMQRASADPETAARYQESCHTRGDGRDLFRQVTVPTLVLQCQGDRVVQLGEARLLASVIPGARLVLVPGGSHYFPTDSGMVDKVVAAINQFVWGAPA